MVRKYIVLPLLIIAIVSSLACMTKSYQNSIEVTRGGSTEANLAIAQSIVTQARFDRLKAELRAQLPTLTEEQLDGLGLRWNQVTMQSLTGQGRRTGVFIIVSVVVKGDFNPKGVIDAASAILARDINESTPVDHGIHP
jgi:hypothetical protein